MGLSALKALTGGGGNTIDLKIKLTPEEYQDVILHIAKLLTEREPKIE